MNSESDAVDVIDNHTRFIRTLTIFFWHRLQLSILQDIWENIWNGVTEFVLCLFAMVVREEIHFIFCVGPLIAFINNKVLTTVNADYADYFWVKQGLVLFFFYAVVTKIFLIVVHSFVMLLVSIILGKPFWVLSLTLHSFLNKGLYIT